MKRILFGLMILTVAAGCSTKPHYTVRGMIEGSDSLTFYLQKREAGKMITLDSALSVKGSFTMKSGAVDYPQMIQLVAGGTRKRTAFYLENSEITITGSLDSLFNAKITGSKTQDEYNAILDSYNHLSDIYSRAYQDYQVARKANNQAVMDQNERKADSVQTEISKLQKEYIMAHPSSYVTPYLIQNLSYEMSPEELEPMINGLDTAIAALPQIKTLKERLMVMKSVSVGQKAPDFTMNDPDGKPVSLSSKIGTKLLLVDFWAAWCNPCRQENPKVVKVYKEFHTRGFDVFGVSLDQSKDDWVKAIADDKLTWTHVSDLKYWGNDAARLYAVNSIPSNFLLDDKGIIIGRNLRGEDLYNKVKEILGN